MSLLRHQVNSGERVHFKKVNEVLLGIVCKLGNLYPEPTMDNLRNANSRRLLEIAEKYERYEGYSRIKVIVMAVLRILKQIVRPGSPNKP